MVLAKRRVSYRWCLCEKYSCTSNTSKYTKKGRTKFVKSEQACISYVSTCTACVGSWFACQISRVSRAYVRLMSDFDLFVLLGSRWAEGSSFFCRLKFVSHVGKFADVTNLGLNSWKVRSRQCHKLCRYVKKFLLRKPYEKLISCRLRVCFYKLIIKY